MKELVLLTSFLIAFAIGSNDASNALSISIGAGVIKFKKAIFLFGILVFAGIWLNGNRVMETVGKNLIQVNPETLGFSLFISAVLIILSNWKKFPLSTHQIIIGSLVGNALASNSLVNFFSLFKIFLSWIISPLVAVFISFFIYKFIKKFFLKIAFFKMEQLLKTFLLISASLISYNIGANEVATVLGPVVYSGISINFFLLLSISSLLVFLGAYILSNRVIETVGKGILPLDPLSGFVAQISAGISLFLFTLLGMPISTTYCMIGAISGIGMTKGLHTVKLELLKKIIFNWGITLFSSFFLSFIFTKLFLLS
ncbi:MAG: Phosphate/sulfate permease [Thermodesulfobacteria bacterium]|nr:anion permease [Thermodesulfobacteriota bacterium]MCU4139014.1 Phosphate/sulfate permease [Thermodesulfobacteriota bacterium]